MDLLERYNKALRTTEDGTIRLLNGVLDQSFQRLVRRARIHMRIGKTDPARRNLALLQEFRKLVPAYRPDRADAYDRVLGNLIKDAQKRGLAAGDDLLGMLRPESPRLDVNIPIEATVSAVSQARGYLQKHGESFAETAATTVAQGIAEGRPTSAMITDMQSRLSIVKSRAETIVRTESLRAYNEASNLFYTLHGVERVLYYATADDRTCPYCAPRAGNIYQRGEIKVPLHPRCRCYLAPWDADTALMDPKYKNMPQSHKKQVARQTAEVVSLNKPAQFEQILPVPLE